MSETDPIQANNVVSEVVSHLAPPRDSMKNAGCTEKALTTKAHADFMKVQFNHRAKHPRLGDTLDYLIGFRRRIKGRILSPFPEGTWG